MEKRAEFLEELHHKMEHSNGPVVLGGDLNLIREMDDKNNSNVDLQLMERFNDFIDSFHLRELRKCGGHYTWTNKLLNPVMVNLDRVLVSNSWDTRFPIAMVTVLTRVGSDHCPLVLDTGEGVPNKSIILRFEKAWLKVAGFKELVIAKWLEQAWLQNTLDDWQGRVRFLRQFLRGWGANTCSEIKKRKQELLHDIKLLDAQAEDGGLTEEEWATRYNLEEQLEGIYQFEELIWQKRAGELWLLEGDANTSFFHSAANGRHRKCHIACFFERNT